MKERHNQLLIELEEKKMELESLEEELCMVSML